MVVFVVRVRRGPVKSRQKGAEMFKNQIQAGIKMLKLRGYTLCQFWLGFGPPRIPEYSRFIQFFFKSYILNMIFC